MTEEIVTRESSTTESMRKAAILVSALNRDSADALLEKMGAEQAARVRNAVFELEIISDEEQDRIVREFVAAGGGSFEMISKFKNSEPDDAPFGERPSRLDEYEDTTTYLSTLQPGHQSRTLKWNEDQASASVDDRDGSTGNERLSRDCAFPILREASAETLANHLSHENAQVIAVVVAHLPPARAAELIALLAPQRQADVLGRVAGLDAAVPAAIEVLQQLEDKLTEEIQVQRSRDVGLATVKSILDAAGSKRHELLNNLQEIDSKLSQQVAKAKVQPLSPHERLEPRLTKVRAKRAAEIASVTRPDVSQLATHEPVTAPSGDTVGEDDGVNPEIQPELKSLPVAEPIAFEELAEFDDESLALLFRAVDPEITLVALAGASSEFVDRVMKPLPSREARSLRRRMERLGPIRLSDMTAAQREVATAATQLVQEGRLPKLVAPRFVVAA